MKELRTHQFVPNVHTVGRVAPVASASELANEPMVWGADLEFARANGGPLTHSVLDAMESEMPLIRSIEALGRYAVVDTESQFLLPDQYPSIPGWHCDSVPEFGEDNPCVGQPDLSQIDEDGIHYTASIAEHPGGVSQTSFAAQSVNIEYDMDHVWDSVGKQAERKLLQRQTMADGDIVRFDQNTLHKSTPCHQKGLRFWLRLSLYHKKPLNKVLNRVQVYTVI